MSLRPRRAMQSAVQRSSDWLVAQVRRDGERASQEWPKRPLQAYRSFGTQSSPSTTLRPQAALSRVTATARRHSLATRADLVNLVDEDDALLLNAPQRLRERQSRTVSGMQAQGIRQCNERYTFARSAASSLCRTERLSVLHGKHERDGILRR
eukprot:3682815-Pleurochrysis_carterae.AAC.1